MERTVSQMFTVITILAYEMAEEVLYQTPLNLSLYALKQIRIKTSWNAISNVSMPHQQYCWFLWTSSFLSRDSADYKECLLNRTFLLLLTYSLIWHFYI
jgi:hypothetical protein